MLSLNTKLRFSTRGQGSVTMRAHSSYATVGGAESRLAKTLANEALASGYSGSTGGALQPPTALTRVQDDAGGTVETASTGGQGLPAGAQTSNIGSPAMMLPLLEGFLPNNPVVYNRLYREIYAFDPTLGSVVDLLSTLPLGDFTLTGLNDEKSLRKYSECLERLKIRQLLPTLSVDYLVLGCFVATTKWDTQQNTFTSLHPQALDFLLIEPVPIHGEDPIVKVQLPKDVIKLLKSDRPELQRFRDKIPAEFLESNSAVTLDNKRLIYIARPGMIEDFRGVSMFKRALPVALMERALIRGTLDIVWKRQRSIVHLMMGDDEWRVTRKDLESVAGLFMSADHDPAGAVIATRHGIDVNLIDRANDGLKYNDFYDFAQAAKLRACGLSDSIFGLESSFGVSEGSINIAAKHMEAYRDLIARELFYRTLFPSIAVANRIKKTQTVVLANVRPQTEEEDRLWHTIRKGMDNRVHQTSEGTWVAEFSAEQPTDILDKNLHAFSMPKIEWKTNLSPTDLNTRMETLTRLAEQGFPISYRMWAAAAGVTLESIAEQRDADIRFRSWLAPWKKVIAKDKAIADGTADIGGGSSEEAASAADAVRELAANHLGWEGPGSGSVNRVGLHDRKMDPDRSVPMIEVGGKLKVRSKKEREAFNDRANREIALATAKVMSRKQNTENAEHNATTKKKYYHASPRGRV